MVRSTRLVAALWVAWCSAVAVSMWLPDASPSSLILSPPKPTHPLGTTPVGADLLWTVALSGLRAQALALVAAGLACIIALPLGLGLAWSNSKLADGVVADASTILEAISPIVILAVILTALPAMPTIGLALILGLVGWTFLVGPVRRGARDLMASGPARALRALGYSRRQTATSYVLPELAWRLAPQVVGLATVYVGTIGAVEFLGLGMRRELSIGYLVLDALERVEQSPRYFVVCLATCVLAVFVLGLASTSLTVAGMRRRGAV